MAILWSEEIDGNLYEVRSAGASVRLYRNGVHHSQFNPNRPLSGAIWDLLVATAFFRPAEAINDALILGFGAGTAGRLLQEIANPQRIVGIDLDPIHLSVADAFFNCSEGCELVAADATQWIESQSPAQPQAYDWILEDLYTEDGNIPSRCAPSTAVWFRKLTKMLKPDGMLVLNIVEPKTVKTFPLFTNAEFKKRFPHVIQLSLPAYDNRVVAFSKKEFDLATYRKNALTFYEKFPRCRGIANKYRLTKLSNA